MTGAKRSPALPAAPTIAEAGVPDYEFATGYGMLAPAGTPVSVIDTLNANIAQAMHTSDLAERFAREGTDVIAGTPAQFGSVIKTEIARWGKVTKAAGLRAD